MQSSRIRIWGVAAALALGIAGAAGCKKDPPAGELPAELRPQPAAVDVDRLAAPPLFAHIPADTPYVMASFEPLPVAYFARIQRALGPVIERSLGKLRRQLDADAAGWLDAIADELDGKWSEQGLESLGFSPRPRFAIYGHGAAPVVLRLELADDQKVMATVERVARRAGVTLPALESRHGREFWRIPLAGDTGAIVAIADRQLVAAIGPRHAVADALPMIVGAERPPRNMGDGKALKELIAKHKLGAQVVGFVDTRRLAAALVALADEQPPADCQAEIDRLAERAPRLVLGGEISGKRATSLAVVELSAELVAELKAMRATVPGFALAFSQSPLLAMGGGVDLARAQTLGRRLALALGDLGDACRVRELREGGNELRRALARPLSGPLAGLTGGAIAVDALELSGGRRGMPIPERLDAVALVTAADPKAVLKLLAAQSPLGDLGITTDGKLHAVDLPGGLPFEVRAGVGERAIVAAVGDGGKRRGEQALEAAGGGPTPFLAMAVDYGKLLDLAARFGGGTALERDLNEAMADLLGRVVLTVDATDHGLGWWYTAELK